MNQTIVVSQKAIETILSRLDELSKEIKFIKNRLAQEEPPYGSEAWWKWSDTKALEDVKKGNCTTIKSKKELDVYFKSLD